MKKLSMSLVLILLTFLSQTQDGFSIPLNTICASDSLMPNGNPSEVAIKACFQKCVDAKRKPLRSYWNCDAPSKSCPSGCYCSCQEKR